MTILAHPGNVQDNGYFCGPATTQTTLIIRGVSLSEAQLAQELGTTVNGTPSVEDIARVLNAHLGAGTYRTVYIGGNSATADQVARLRTDLAASIGSGYGIAINVVGTATTADGREVNSYPGGHYIPVTGYDTATDLAWCTDVADGHEYWMTTKALADWIATRGYATLAHPTAPEDHMQVIVFKDRSGQIWRLSGDMLWRERITETALGHMRYWSNPDRHLLTKLELVDLTGGDPVDLEDPDVSSALGVDVATLQGGAPGPHTHPLSGTTGPAE